MTLTDQQRADLRGIVTISSDAIRGETDLLIAVETIKVLAVRALNEDRAA